MRNFYFATLVIVVIYLSRLKWIKYILQLLIIQNRRSQGIHGMENFATESIISCQCFTFTLYQIEIVFFYSWFVGIFYHKSMWYNHEIIFFLLMRQIMLNFQFLAILELLGWILLVHIALSFSYTAILQIASIF